jgi:acyl-CoA reductase-like NAD-dependent aldehyde dehydrogenase
MLAAEKSLDHYNLYIGGAFRSGNRGERFETQNPYTGQTWATVVRGDTADVAAAAEAAHRAFRTGDWPLLSASQRGALLRRLGDLIADNAEWLAKAEVRDNGKLIAEMLGQMRALPKWYYYYAGLADKVEGRMIPLDIPDIVNYTRYEPLGVVAIIVPWNSPLLVTSYTLPAALAAGNTVVIKPSESTSTSIMHFVRLVEEAGFPPGVVNVVTGFGPEVGMPLVEHPLVSKIVFTGSEATGTRVYEAAARGLKRVTLELGGKSPNIVFDDAEFDNAVKGVVAGIFAASGQTCVAGSRLLLQESIHDRFVDRLMESARSARMGDPMDQATNIGPISTRPQYDKVLHYIDIAKGEGARLVLGGTPATRPECGDGWFIEPTIFAGVRNDTRIAQEEVFGPVLSVIPFKDEDDAAHIANDVMYGLAAGVWTQNLRRAHVMAERLAAGTVWVNTYRAISCMSPFGGYKRSGIGRENGAEAIKEFLQVKSVWISTATEFPDPFVIRT